VREEGLGVAVGAELRPAVFLAQTHAAVLSLRNTTSATVFVASLAPSSAGFSIGRLPDCSVVVRSASGWMVLRMREINFNTPRLRCEATRDALPCRDHREGNAQPVTADALGSGRITPSRVET